MSNDDKKNDRSEFWSQLSGGRRVGFDVRRTYRRWHLAWQLIDAKIHTTPWIALVLALGGLIGGMSYMVMKAMKTERNRSKRQDYQPRLIWYHADLVVCFISAPAW